MTPLRDSASTRFHGALLAGLILVFLPTWLWLGEAWLSDPYYSHGPAVLAVALYLAWNTRRALAARAPSRWGQALVAPALAVHLAVVAWRAFYISALMLPLALLGFIVLVFGWGPARRFAFPLAFLLLMVPLPLTEWIGPMFEGWAASSATWLAQALGVDASNTGAQVTLPNSTLTVGIPLGGLGSVIALISLAALLAYIMRGATWARSVVFFAAVPVALAANTLRLALLLLIASHWGTQAVQDYHTWSSPVLFLAVLALLVLLARMLRCSQVRWEVVFPQ